MSKKTILNETQIRRFMKLAAMEPLSEPFVKGSAFTLSEQLPPGPPDELDAAEEEDPMAGMPGDVEGDLGEPAEGPGAGGVDIESLVSAIADAIEQETGVEVSVEGEGGDDEDLGAMADLGAEEDLGDMGSEADMVGMEQPAKMYEQNLRNYIRHQVAHLLYENDAESDSDSESESENE